MTFSREFFDLQVSFAERVAALAGIPLERALLESTNLYVRFGLGRDFDPGHPSWRAYLAGLRGCPDPRGWTNDFYRRDAEANTSPALVASFGCFGYALPRPDRVRLHLVDANRGAKGGDFSPLARSRAPQRRRELKALFGHLRESAGGEARVVGVSWLYNLEAYRRLFPPRYTASPRVIRGGFRSMALWGQLLDHRGAVKEPVARAFRRRLEGLSDAARAEACFPLPVLTVEAPVRDFCAFYGAGGGQDQIVHQIVQEQQE